MSNKPPTGGSNTVQYSWSSTELSSGTPATYQWMFDFDTGNFMNPTKAKNSSGSGSDTTVQLTYTELASMMTAEGVYYQDTMFGQWTVKATGGPVTKNADQPFLLNLRRGILDSDIIFSFSLDEPDDDTLVVYNSGTKINTFNWQRTNSTAGPNVKYEVQLAWVLDDLKLTSGKFISDNGGVDTLASISDADLASLAQAYNLDNGKTERFKWRVLAEIGGMTKVSIDSNWIWIRREDPPWIGISENKSGQIEVYPNPADNEFNVKLNDFSDENVEVRIYDILGAKLYSRTFSGQQNIKVTLEERFPEGSYILQVMQGELNFRKKVVVRRASD